MVKRILKTLKVDLARLFSEPKTWFCVAIWAIFGFYIFSPFFTIARYYNVSAQPWLFPFFLSRSLMLILHGGLSILLFSDLPMNDGYAQMMLPRCGRKDFFLSQILYIIVVSLLFTLIPFILSIVFILPVIGWSSEWGDLITALSQSMEQILQDTGVVLSVSLYDEILVPLSPWMATCMALLFMWLVTAFFGSTILFFSVWISKASAFVVSGILISLSLFSVYLGRIVIGKWLIYISPATWANIASLDWMHVGETPSPAYALTVLVGGIVLMNGFGMLKYCRKDLR